MKQYQTCIEGIASIIHNIDCTNSMQRMKIFASIIFCFRICNTGEVVFEAGNAGDCAYLVEEGTFEV
mgnify:CR=1 FL=1